MGTAGLPFGIAVSPNGTSAYDANSAFAGTVSQYDIGGDGKLTAKAPATVAAGMNPLGVAVSPDSGSVYVTNGGGDNISQYDAGPGGALAAKPSAMIPAGQSPFTIAVDGSGTSVYVTNQGADRAAGGNAVSQHDVESGGGLVAKGTPSVPAGEKPRGVALSRDGASVYVADQNSAAISQYDIGSGGALTAKPTPAVAAGAGPDGIAVSPSAVGRLLPVAIARRRSRPGRRRSS